MKYLPDYIDSAQRINHDELPVTFSISSEGEVVLNPGDRAPDEVHHISRDVLEIGADGWEAVGGFTNQQGYDGPVNHPSEFFSAPMLRRLHFEVLSDETPRTHALVEVTDPDDPDALVGWAVLRRTR